MKEAIIKIIKHSTIYGMGKIATQFIAFLLIPIYTSHLTTQDYGILQICNIFTAILVTIISLGMSSSLFKVYYSIDKNRKGDLLGTTFITYIAFSIIILTPLFVFGKPLANIIIGNYEHSYYLFKVLLFAVFFEGFINLQFAILRAKEESIKYGLISIIRIIVYASMNILFVVSFKRNYVGVKEAAFISLIISFLIMIPILMKNIKWRFSKVYAKEVLHIGIPLAIGGLAVWVLNLTDRFMIKYLMSPAIALSQIGIYSLGDKFAMIVKFILVMPFMLSWGPLMYSYQDNPEAKKIYTKVLHSFSFIAGFLFFFIALFSREMIELMARDKSYLIAYKVVPILASSKMLLGLYMIFTVGVTLTYKTKYMAFSNYIAAGLNILLNFIFIPKIGVIGAAIASLISYIVLVTLLYNFSQKFYYVNWKINRVIFYLAFLFIISSISIYSNLNLFIKAIIFIIIMPTLPLFKLVSYKEINTGLKFIKNKIST